MYKKKLIEVALPLQTSKISSPEQTLMLAGQRLGVTCTPLYIPATP